MNKIISLLAAFVLIINAQTKNQINQQIINSGLTLEQAKEIANQQGLNNNINSKIYVEPDNKDISSIDVLSNDTDLNESIDKQVKPSISIENQISNEVQYYGYNIFQGDPSIFQSSTFGTIDPNYNIGPGDKIIVMLWGESQFRQEFTINREGYVFLPEVGQIFVNGLDLKSLERKIFLILSKVYSTLNPELGKPTTFMDVSLGDLRPLRIIVLGELSQPGAYSVNPATSLSSSLFLGA